MSDRFEQENNLDPEGARMFFSDIIYFIQSRVQNLCSREDRDLEYTESDKPSAAKEYYGDSWTFIYGINTGMRLMKDEKITDYDWDRDEVVDYGIKGDDRWQDHYDQYGYGTYGRGLKIGKRLAFYEDRDFSFTHEVEEPSDESGFTIKSYD